MPEHFTGEEETITALATPPGSGAISVIRISGSDSFKISDAIFQGRTKISDAKSHTILYGNITDNSEIIDDVLISVFRAPHSYTGENSVEISTHGSFYIVQKIIGLLILNGARAAEPGEFTKRAFLNGKMDLSQAEAVLDIINSRTETSLRGARNQFDGVLSGKINQLREQLINSISLLELELDFAEEDLEFISKDKITGLINFTINEIGLLIDSYKYGRVIKDGINISLAGPTNVGKSSLLNYLLKESRAIVSSIPGTTRDVIREEIYIDGILYRFFDTAGIRDTNDCIEKEGVSRSREIIKQSDIVLFIYDITQSFDNDLLNEIFSLTEKEKVILVANKADLDNKILTENLNISALTGHGINALLEAIKNKTFESKIYSEKTAIISNVRHLMALKKSKEHLSAAVDSLNKTMSGEFIAVDIRVAIDCLGEIIGKVTSEDVLGNIFANFCIGK